MSILEIGFDVIKYLACGKRSLLPWMIPPVVHLRKLIKSHKITRYTSTQYPKPYPWCRFGCKMVLRQASLSQVSSPDRSHLIYVVFSPQTFKVTAAISLANRPTHCIPFLCQESTRQLGLSMFILG